MFVTGDSIVYSASDLAAAARCQYALLREFDAKLGRGPAVAVDDELMARAAVLGSAHEGRRLDQLRHEFGDAVAIIGRPAYTPAGLAAAADATRRAIANHAPVVYQAAMFDGRFVGFADFLIRDGHRYRVADTKLARSPTVTALLQLAAYADALVHSGVPVAADAELELGDGTIVRYRVGELIPVYRSQRALLQRLLDGHYTAGTAVRWDDERVQACFRCPQCTERLRASDDLLLVGGIRVRQRDKLLEAGITTIAELADHTAPVPGLTTNALGKLTAQAKLQIRQRDTGAPQFEIVDPRPLTLLPEPNPGDLFFDFEGDPLWTADGKQWGLEYLFGVLEAGRAGVFRPLWAHDRTAERQALTDFLAIVARRRRRHPNMHIYHYAPYEKTALLRLVGRYGIGEDDVDDLLRNGVLVDLYPLVRKSIRVGTDSFSLKALEPLYLGTQPRSGDVTTAADSINSYARYCELRAAGRIDEAATVLKEIEGYNHYDCRSTRALRDGCSCAPGKPASHPLALNQFRTPTLSTTVTRWRRYCPSSPAMPPPASARRNRQRSPCWPLPAAIIAARTSRSGGRTSTGSTTPSTNGRTARTSSLPARLRSPSTGICRLARASRSGGSGLPVNWHVGTSTGMCLPSTNPRRRRA